jgi:hypothetical protein
MSLISSIKQITKTLDDDERKERTFSVKRLSMKFNFISVQISSFQVSSGAFLFGLEIFS